MLFILKYIHKKGQWSLRILIGYSNSASSEQCLPYSPTPSQSFINELLNTSNSAIFHFISQPCGHILCDLLLKDIYYCLSCYIQEEAAYLKKEQKIQEQKVNYIHSNSETAETILNIQPIQTNIALRSKCFPIYLAFTIFLNYENGMSQSLFYFKLPHCLFQMNM